MKSTPENDVTAPKTRTWVDGLDNLGENLIRLSSTLKTIESSSEALASDPAFVAALGPAATGYAKAFRQAHPVLVSGETSFLALLPPAVESVGPSLADETLPPFTLVHEGILGSEEMVRLLERVGRAGSADPAGTRHVLSAHLLSLADSTALAGWALRTVCHEYLAEVRLLGSAPNSLDELGPGAHGLRRDMADAAKQLRWARREWFRVDQRLAAATGVLPGPPLVTSLPT